MISQPTYFRKHYLLSLKQYLNILKKVPFFFKEGTFSQNKKISTLK